MSSAKDNRDTCRQEIERCMRMFLRVWERHWATVPAVMPHVVRGRRSCGERGEEWTDVGRRESRPKGRAGTGVPGN